MIRNLLNRNLFFAAAGLFVGFVVGFLLANSTAHTSSAVPTVRTSPALSAPPPAPPLDPSEAGGALPAGHPDIGTSNGADGGNTSLGVASSAQAQVAMEAADRNPADYDAQMTAAAIFYQLTEYDKVEFYLKRALAVKPKDVDALTALGNMRYDAADFSGAASFYERALSQQPNDPDVRTDLGNTYYQRTPPNYDRAITEYRKALSLDPRHEKALQNLAAASLQKGDQVTARDAIARLAAVNPSNPALAPLRAQAR